MALVLALQKLPASGIGTRGVAVGSCTSCEEQSCSAVGGYPSCDCE
jgi:hypothetical protein